MSLELEYYILLNLFILFTVETSFRNGHRNRFQVHDLERRTFQQFSIYDVHRKSFPLSYDR